MNQLTPAMAQLNRLRDLAETITLLHADAGLSPAALAALIRQARRALGTGGAQ